MTTQGSGAVEAVPAVRTGAYVRGDAAASIIADKHPFAASRLGVLPPLVTLVVSDLGDVVKICPNMAATFECLHLSVRRLAVHDANAMQRQALGSSICTIIDFDKWPFWWVGTYVSVKVMMGSIVDSRLGS